MTLQNSFRNSSFPEAWSTRVAASRILFSELLISLMSDTGPRCFFRDGSYMFQRLKEEWRAWRWGGMASPPSGRVAGLMPARGARRNRRRSWLSASGQNRRDYSVSVRCKSAFRISRHALTAGRRTRDGSLGERRQPPDGDHGAERAREVFPGGARGIATAGTLWRSLLGEEQEKHSVWKNDRPDRSGPLHGRLLTNSTTRRRGR